MKVDATSMHVEVKGTVTFLESVTKLVALANAAPEAEVNAALAGLMRSVRFVIETDDGRQTSFTEFVDAKSDVVIGVDHAVGRDHTVIYQERAGVVTIPMPTKVYLVEFDGGDGGVDVLGIYATLKGAYACVDHATTEPKMYAHHGPFVQKDGGVWQGVEGGGNGAVVRIRETQVVP